MTNRTELHLWRYAVQQQREQRWLDKRYPTRRINRKFQLVGITTAEFGEALARLHPTVTALYPLFSVMLWRSRRDNVNRAWRWVRGPWWTKKEVRNG